MEARKVLVVTPSVEAQLNERQKDMVKLLLEGNELTSRDCEARFGGAICDLLDM